MLSLLDCGERVVDEGCFLALVNTDSRELFNCILMLLFVLGRDKSFHAF